MKKVTLWSFGVIAVIVVFAVVAALQFGEQSPLIASGMVRLTPELKEEAKGVRTLFITVFDAESGMPMPYGAMRTSLDENAEGDFYQFVLTRENLRVMNPNAPVPARLRLKARLDQDGLGGQDQPGDLTGERPNVAYGENDVTIVIDQLL